MLYAVKWKTTIFLYIMQTWCRRTQRLLRAVCQPAHAAALEPQTPCVDCVSAAQNWEEKKNWHHWPISWYFYRICWIELHPHDHYPLQVSLFEPTCYIFSRLSFPSHPVLSSLYLCPPLLLSHTRTAPHFQKRWGQQTTLICLSLSFSHFRCLSLLT